MAIGMTSDEEWERIWAAKQAKLKTNEDLSQKYIGKTISKIEVNMSGREYNGTTTISFEGTDEKLVVTARQGDTYCFHDCVLSEKT